jgi:tRNA dimethylallyltransferase
MAAEPENGPPSSISHSAPLLLAGPTAVGKSEIAALLAERLGGEIISVDSMQVYRGMDIGTAKPSPGERARVPHHLIDVLDLPESFDAAQFLQLAHRAVSDIQARGRVPILCGGTGLYFKVFLDGLGQTPPVDAALRALLRATPLPELLRELAERDPAAYERIDRQNPRRVIRAIEVIRLTGQPFSSQRSNWQPSPLVPRSSSLQFGLARTPADLHRRIEARVDAMFRRGWVAETEALLKRGLAQNQTAMQALGYRHIVEHLRGERSLADTIALIKIRTRQFAKRQMTWFRRQLRLTWVHLEPQSSAEEIVKTIAAH